MAVTVRTTAVVARHRAESAADLAALAAAAAIGVADDSEAVCAAAGPIAEANGASLASCAPAIDADGRTGSVTVRVTVLAHLPGWGAVRPSATARAGRLQAPITRSRASSAVSQHTSEPRRVSGGRAAGRWLTVRAAARYDPPHAVHRAEWLHCGASEAAAGVTSTAGSTATRRTWQAAWR